MGKFFSTKKISLITILGVVLIMIPILYLSFFNRASGDDYGYGKLTRMAWTGSHSLLKVFAAAGEEVRNVYYGWQGTWMSVFLFTLQPEVFHEDAYVATAFIMTALLFGSICFLFREFFGRQLHFSRWSRVMAVSLFWLNSILFVPRYKSAVYWYNGTVHYTVPFAMCLFLTVLLLRYVEEYKIRQFIGIFFIMAVLGGANYQAALFALIVTVYIGGWTLICKKRKRALWLLLPLTAELTGLGISMKAPGNKVRGGEGFGFSLAKGIKAVGESFAGGICDIKDYLLEKPLVFVLFLLMFLFLAEAWSGVEEIKRKNTGLFLLAFFCLYCAMQAPAAYAGVEVSGGVYNTNYWVFLLFFTAVLTVAARETVLIFRKMAKMADEAWSHKYLVMPGLIVCAFLCIVFRGNMKESLWYTCVDYIYSGQAADYREQMELQTRILTDASVRDAVVPFINDYQGPLMHMPVTADPEAWTNTVTGQFYGKDSVVAILRPEWEEKYGSSFQD